MTTSYRPAASTAAPLDFTLATDTRFAVDASLLERARALGPIVRDHAAEAERERRLARPVLEAMRTAGLCRMTAPRAFGGLELDPMTVARVTEEIAAFDSAAGWMLQSPNTGAWWASRLPAEGAAELFADGPDLAMAASFSPPHRTVEAPGGWRITGRGPLASGIHDARWVMLTGIVFDSEQPRTTPAGPDIVSVVLRADEVEIVDTWRSLGMRGTDSNDVAAPDVFVPASRSFRLDPSFVPDGAFAGPLYRLPAVGSVLLAVVPVALAVARGAITELRALADRKTALGFARTIRHRGAVQAALAEAEATLRSARLLFYDTLAVAWRRAVAGETATLEHRADLLLAGTHAVRSAAHVTELMHRMAGTSGIYERSPLERHFRDAHTVRHHGFACESRLETVGQVYLGVEPEFGMVAF